MTHVCSDCSVTHMHVASVQCPKFVHQHEWPCNRLPGSHTPACTISVQQHPCVHIGGRTAELVHPQRAKALVPVHHECAKPRARAAKEERAQRACNAAPGSCTHARARARGGPAPGGGAF